MYSNIELYQKCIEKIIPDNISEIKGKSFLITGAGGLVGSFLVDVLMYLNKKYNFGIKIFATFTSRKSYESRFPSYMSNEFLIPVVQDITKPMELDNSVDYVVHAASNTHPLLYATKPVETAELNVLGTINVLRYAIKNKKTKTLLLSTLEVYGEDKAVESFSEEDIGVVDFNKPRACYPESKRLAETLCHSFIQEYGADVMIARLGYIYGPTVKMDSSKADVQFLNNALNREPIIMKSAGLQRRSYCFVADVIGAIITILLSGKCSEVYNIASENGNVMLRDYAKTLAEISGCEIRFEEAGAIEKSGGSKVMNSTLNAKKLITLGWSSKYTFSEGIENTYKIKKEILCLKN